MVRKISASLAVLGLVGVALVGCSASGAAACPRPAASTPALSDLVEVSGPIDDEPDVDIRTPLRASDDRFVDVETGQGTPITTDDQLVVLDLSLFSGETGENLVSSPYDGELTRITPMTQWTQLIPGLGNALHCTAEGSRIVVTIPPGGIDPEAASGLGVTDDESSIAVVDVRKVYLPAANGTAQFNADRGVPTVVRAPDGRPGIIVPDAAAPSELIVQTLLKGDGPEVTGDVPVRVHYTGITWDERAVFDTSWDGEARPLELDALIPGFAEALQGQTVGSQVLAVIPPDQGYGAQGSGSVPPDATLVFVVDILGLDPAPSS